MEFLQLRYFADAAKTQNFSHTAKKYSVPQSTVSQTIKKLESELGVLLFDRKGNKVVLNKNGEILQAAADTTFKVLDDAKRRLSDSTDEINGEIRLLVRSNRRLITEYILEFKRRYPKVSFSIKHDYLCRNYSDFDVIIAEELPELKSFSKRLLIDESIKLAVSRDNPLSKKDAVSLSELKAERFITMLQGSSLNRLFMDTCHLVGFEPDIIIESDDPFYLRKYVEMGMGIAFFPSFSWQGQISKEIKLLSISDSVVRRKTYIYCNPTRYISRVNELFMQHIVEKTKQSI